jgi:hypothetical protein
LDLDEPPNHLVLKHHLGVYHLHNGEGAFFAFKKWSIIDVLAHLYIMFLENGPLAMMQVGLIRNAM